MARRKERAAKHGGGKFFAISQVMVKSDSFARLSPHALKLLFDLLAGYTGFNNGDLSAAWKLMSARGWRSRDTLNKALRELLDGGWIVKTRQGGLHRCSLYAVTFFDVDDVRDKSGYSKFDTGVSPTSSPLGGWFRDAPSTVAVTQEASKKKP